MTFLELTEGPLWYIAVTVFLLGVVWRLAGILMIGRYTGYRLSELIRFKTFSDA